MKKSIIFLFFSIILRLNGGELCISSDLSPDQYGKIILITGISSCGKTSVSEAVKKIFAEQNIPYILLHGDEFYQLLPGKWFSFDPSKEVVPGGGKMITRYDQKGQPFIQFERGEVVEKMGHARGPVIASFALNGINIIYEEVLPEIDIMNVGAFHLFKNFSVYIIQVDCPLEFAQENERKRQGIIGLAATQKSQVVFPRYADIRVQNGPGIGIDNLAREIVNYINTYPPQAFKMLEKDFEEKKIKNFP